MQWEKVKNRSQLPFTEDYHKITFFTDRSASWFLRRTLAAVCRACWVPPSFDGQFHAGVQSFRLCWCPPRVVEIGEGDGTGWLCADDLSAEPWCIRSTSSAQLSAEHRNQPINQSINQQEDKCEAHNATTTVIRLLADTSTWPRNFYIQSPFWEVLGQQGRRISAFVSVDIHSIFVLYADTVFSLSIRLAVIWKGHFHPHFGSYRKANVVR